MFIRVYLVKHLQSFVGTRQVVVCFCSAREHKSSKTSPSTHKIETQIKEESSGGFKNTTEGLE